MPCVGPVAYQVHDGSFVVAVICRGAAQVRPSSFECVSHTVRGALPSVINPSGPAARFWQNGSQMVPVFRSTTGQGLPQVMSATVTTTWAALQVCPSSSLRRDSRSICPLSEELWRRPSQNASTVPPALTTRAGMR